MGKIQTPICERCNISTNAVRKPNTYCCPKCLSIITTTPKSESSDITLKEFGDLLDNGLITLEVSKNSSEQKYFAKLRVKGEDYFCISGLSVFEVLEKINFMFKFYMRKNNDDN